MGKIKGHIQDWLEEYGYSLGYDMANAPEIDDLDWVANDDIDASTNIGDTDLVVVQVPDTNPLAQGGIPIASLTSTGVKTKSGFFTTADIP